jgi:GNAT superfamily N-acetyltransferase
MVSSSPQFLSSSRSLLESIADSTYNVQIRPIAIKGWQQQLQPDNPLWRHLTVKRFIVDTPESKAHVFAMIDERLPHLGLVGFFACTDLESGSEVLRQATDWLKKQDLDDVYGPINGTITRDYRLNLDDDYRVPGEPVNPKWYADVFRASGFSICNRYVSGRAKHYRLFAKLLMIGAPRPRLDAITLRPANTTSPAKDFRIYHELMNEIFPHNSIYCPVLSWEERQYNIGDPKELFHQGYSYFLEDDGEPIGFIIAYPYEGELILKTIGILPEYRGRGLFGMLVNTIHQQAARDGLTAAVYATIRVGNAVYRKRRPGVRTYRRYVTMHKAI